MKQESLPSEEQMKLVLWLSRIGMKASAARAVLEQSRSIDEALSTPEEKRLSSLMSGKLAASALRSTDRIWQWCMDDNDVAVISQFDPRYPRNMLELDTAPLVLYVKGKLYGPKSVACIGTREPTHFGAKAASRITEMLAEYRWSIVSGLATGIDSICHEAALERGAHTVAVMAQGLDEVYPRANQRLARRIVEQGGALVSEYPPGVLLSKSSFVARDRLQAAMSVGTICMQSDVVGGSMHTVRATLKLRRPLFVPMPPEHLRHEVKSQGNIALATKAGPDLCDMIRTDSDYASLLCEEHKDRPPAKGIYSKSDYPALLDALGSKLAK